MHAAPPTSLLAGEVDDAAKVLCAVFEEVGYSVVHLLHLECLKVIDAAGTGCAAAWLPLANVLDLLMLHQAAASGVIAAAGTLCGSPLHCIARCAPCQVARLAARGGLPAAPAYMGYVALVHDVECCFHCRMEVHRTPKYHQCVYHAQVGVA